MTTRPVRKPLAIKRLRAIFLIALMIGLSLFTGVMITLEDRVSERFGPEVREDLEWRALRGAHELALAADVGLAVNDREIVTESFGVYAASRDVAAIYAIDAQGKIVAQHGDLAFFVPLFTGTPGTLTSGAGYLTSWAPSMIEGVEVGKVAIVISTQRLTDAEDLLSDERWITFLAGGIGLLFGAIGIVFFTRAITSRDRQLQHYANNLEQAVVLRTWELDGRNREMQLVLDSVAQGFVMVDLRGVMASERSAIVETWFGASPPDTSFVSFIEPHAPEFAVWFELALGTLADGLMPTDVCIAQMPTRFAVGGRAFEVGYRPIMDDGELDRILVIISDVTEKLARERSEREQRELLVMFQRISNDPAGVDELMAEVTGLLAILTAPCDVIVERRILHTLKGNCALFGLELYSELCHAIETELADSLSSLSDAQRRSLVDGWQTVTGWLGRLRGANRDDIVEIQSTELAQLLQRAQQGASNREIMATLTKWTMEPVARRFDRLAQHAKGLARRMGKGELEIEIADGGVRLDGAHWSPFWAAAVHAVRNSIDHGLESTETRVALGKPASGRLIFHAEQSMTATTIAFSDDGRGIDWDAIAERARVSGMPSATHEDLVAALFEDGLTTCDVVSETSGRGIGMAALRHAVGGLGGMIEIATTPGAGTHIICRFPRVLHLPTKRMRTRAADSTTYTSKLPRIDLGSVVR